MSAGASFSYAQESEAFAFVSKQPVTKAILFRDTAQELIVSYSQVIGIAIEPFFALFVNATFGFVNAILGMPLDIVTTPLSYPVVLFLFFVFVFGGKILLSFPSSQVFAMVTYGELEKAVGYLSILMTGIYGVSQMTAFCSERANDIMLILGSEGGNGIFVAVSVVLSFGSACVSLILYYIVKTVILCANIIQMPFAFLPGVSFLFECAKSFIVAILCSMNLIFPVAGFLLNLLIVIFSCILFVKCYYVVDFYRAIYLRPTLHSLGIGTVSDRKINEKTSQWILDYMKEQNETIVMSVPSYLVHTFSKEQEMRQYEYWWYVCTEQKQYLCRKKYSAKKPCVYELSNSQPIYFKESFRYLEFFTLDGPEEKLNMIFNKPQKDLHFVISHDYVKLFETLKQSADYRDYLALKQKLKAQDEERRKKEKLSQTEHNNIMESQAI